MNKYIIEYTDYEHIVSLLGYKIPHSNYSNVSTIVVDLTEEEYEALLGAHINITPNESVELCSWPADIAPTGAPPPFMTYSNIFNSHTAGFDGTGVNIALLGTGCSALAAATVPTLIQQDYTGLGIGESTTHESRGTMILGMTLDYYTPFSALDYGIASGAQQYSMRTYEGGSAAYIAAISWCISNNIHIINISATVASLNSAIAAAIAAGIIVVASSGNALVYPVTFPAGLPDVIAVSGVDTSVTGMPLFGSYKTSDGTPKVIVVMYNGGGYPFFIGGTSQSAWQLSGLLAIYKQKYPSLDYAKATNLLRHKAIQMDGYTYTVPSSTRNISLNYETGAGFMSPIN